MKIRAYIPNHPNVALYFGSNQGKRCPVCGSHDLQPLDVSAFTNLSEFSAYRCGDCGTVKRDAVSKTTTETRKDLLRNITK